MSPNEADPIAFCSTPDLPPPVRCDDPCSQVDLHRLLVRHPPATFLLRLGGPGPAGSGLAAGDLLVIDRALEPASGDWAVATADGELRLTRWPPPPGTAATELWGVATAAVRGLRPLPLPGV
jgi:DNA polymerase V